MNARITLLGEDSAAQIPVDAPIPAGLAGLGPFSRIFTSTTAPRSVLELVARLRPAGPSRLPEIPGSAAGTPDAEATVRRGVTLLDDALTDIPGSLVIADPAFLTASVAALTGRDPARIGPREAWILTRDERELITLDRVVIAAPR